MRIRGTHPAGEIGGDDAGGGKTGFIALQPHTGASGPFLGVTHHFGFGFHRGDLPGGIGHGIVTLNGLEHAVDDGIHKGFLRVALVNIQKLLFGTGSTGGAALNDRGFFRIEAAAAEVHGVFPLADDGRGGGELHGV